MNEERYFSIDYDEEYYVFDSHKISQEEVEERAEYNYDVFAESLTTKEILELLNKNEQLQQIHNENLVLIDGLFRELKYFISFFKGEIDITVHNLLRNVQMYLNKQDKIPNYSFFFLIDENEELKQKNKMFRQAQVQLADLNLKMFEENEQLKEQLSDIEGQLVMFDQCDNWDYDRVMYTVRHIAEIMGYDGGI